MRSSPIPAPNFLLNAGVAACLALGTAIPAQAAQGRESAAQRDAVVKMVAAVLAPSCGKADQKIAAEVFQALCADVDRGDLERIARAHPAAMKMLLDFLPAAPAVPGKKPARPDAARLTPQELAVLANFPRDWEAAMRGLHPSQRSAPMDRARSVPLSADPRVALVRLALTPLDGHTKDERNVFGWWADSVKCHPAVRKLMDFCSRLRRDRDGKALLADLEKLSKSHLLASQKEAKRRAAEAAKPSRKMTQEDLERGGSKVLVGFGAGLAALFMGLVFLMRRHHLTFETLQVRVSRARSTVMDALRKSTQFLR
jgi:hypothetical protein